jgi:HK97 family phage portal protein
VSLLRSALLGERRSESKVITWRDLVGDDWGGASRSGVAVTHETALSVPAFYRCIEIRSNTILRMGAPKVQRRGSKGWEDAPEHPIAAVLATIPGMPPEFFYQTRAAHRITHGRGAAYVDRAGTRVVRLIPLDPTRLQPFRENGLDGFLYTSENAGQRKIPAADIWNWISLGWDGVSGYSALRQARETLGAAIAAREHGASVFRNGAAPGLVFEVPTVLSEESAKRLKQSLDARFAGVDNHFKSILLEEGLKVANAPTMMTADDAQLVESRGFDSREIAVRLGVPPAWVGDTATRTFATAEQEAQVFLENTADPDIRSCEASLSYVLLTEEEKRRGDVRIVFDRTPLGMADVKSQAEADKAALAGMPWATLNEVRQRRGLGPVEGGDVIQIPINLQQAAKPGSPAAGGTDPSPPKDPPPADPDPAAARKASGFDAAVTSTRSRMRDRLVKAARAAGKDPSKFTAWADGAREAHEPVVREAFAFADGIVDTKAEVDGLFASLRSACDAAQAVKVPEFPAALDAALVAMERAQPPVPSARGGTPEVASAPSIVVNVTVPERSVTVNGGPVDARTTVTTPPVTVTTPPVTVTPPDVHVSVDARGVPRSLTFRRDADGKIVAAESTGV